jgi:hypothetical protein
MGVMRAGDTSDAKIYLNELITDVHMSLPMNIISDLSKHLSLPMNIRPVEAFEISVCEIEE